MSNSIAASHQPFLKKFTFSDGTVKLSCGVKGCAFGRGNYSSTSIGNRQGTKHTAVDELPELPMIDDEVEQDDVPELLAEIPVVAGADDDEEVIVEDAETGKVKTILKSELEAADNQEAEDCAV
jgi:hypothetical protein